MFVVKNINNNSSLRSTDLQVVGNISAANLASGECTIDKLILTESLKVNDISLSLNQLENIKHLDISGSLTASLYDLNQKIWNVNTGDLVNTLLGHTAYVNGVAFNSDNLLASASEDQTVKLWKP